MAPLPLAGPVAAVPVLCQLLPCSCRCTCLWFSGARCAASRSRLPVPGVAARPVRRGLHVQVLRFPDLGIGEPSGPVPGVNVTVHLDVVPLPRDGLGLGGGKHNKASVIEQIPMGGYIISIFAQILRSLR